MGRWDKLTATKKSGKRFFNRKKIDDAFARLHTAAARDSDAVIPLADFVTQNCEFLPSEETAHSVVLGIFLRQLAVPSAADKPILKALHCLLGDDQHASSILTPLTDAVLESGEEKLVPNPVQQELFRVLSVRLRETPTQAALYECWIAALRSARNLNVRSSIVIQLPTIQFVYSNSGESHALAIQLILAQVQLQPSIAPFVYKFLLLSPISPKKQTKDTTIPSIREVLQTSNKSTAHTCELLQLLLKHVPFTLWIPKSKRPQRLSTFSSQVVDSLRYIMEALLTRELVVDDVSLRLIGTILQSVPYRDHPRLRKSAVLLCEALFQDTPSKAADDVLCDCLGGRMKPNGELTRPCVAVVDWLQSPSGKAALRKLVDTAYQVDTVSILSAVLRVHPDALCCDATHWQSFCDATMAILNDNESKQMTKCASLLEHLLRGRRDFGMKTDDVNLVEFVFGVLPRLLDGNATCKVACCVAYESLLQDDWLRLEAPFDHAQLVLALTDPDKHPSKVRAASWKATGQLSPRLLGASDDMALSAQWTDAIVAAVIKATRGDQVTAILTMTWFACGNLFQVLCQRTEPLEWIHPEQFKVLVTIGIALARERIDKVSVNAVRAMGYFVCAALKSDPTSYHLQCSVIVEVFESRLKAVYELTMGMDSEHYTYNQRVGLQKLGRGACNALNAIFDESALATSHTMFIAPVQWVVDCLLYRERFESKFVDAAFAVLLSIDTKATFLFVGSPAMDRFCPLLYSLLFDLLGTKGENQLQPRTLPKLISHLLPLASMDVITKALVELQTNSRDDLMYLCEWMCENDLGDEVEKWAEATRLVEGLDIAVEEKFATMAARLKDTHNQDDQDEL